jgi:hypothetical protein
MKYLGTTSFVAALAFSMSASAAVVCNDAGDCWRTKERLTYPPEARVEIYDDDHVIDTKKYKLREPGEGRGYWRGPPPGVWINF